MSGEAGLLSSVVEMVFQSLAYGLSVVLAVVSTRLIVNRGWKSRNNMIMLSMIWSMFILSSLHWIISFVYMIAQIISSTASESNVRPLHDLMTAVGKVNYGIADGVLVWRAWVLCKDKYRRWLLACNLSLGFTLLAVAMAITLRLACNAHRVCPVPIVHGLDVSQVGTLIISTLTNTLSTGIIGAYVWNHRELIRATLSANRTTRNIRALLLLVESGLLYTTFVFFSVIGSVIRIPTGTIGDVSGSVLIYISGVYPTIIISIASVQDRINTSAFTVHLPHDTNNTDRRNCAGSVSWARPGPMLTLGSADAARDASPRKPSSISNVLSSFAFGDFETDIMKSLDAKWPLSP